MTHDHLYGRFARSPPMRSADTLRQARAEKVADGDRSDAQALASLAATRSKDGAAGASTHAQTESVHLVTAPVVRLIRTLAHQIALSLAGHKTGQRYALASAGVKPTPAREPKRTITVCGELLATHRGRLLSSKNRVPHSSVQHPRNTGSPAA